MVNLSGPHFEDVHPLYSETSWTHHGAEYFFVSIANASLTLDFDAALFATSFRRRFRVHQCSFGGAERSVALHR